MIPVPPNTKYPRTRRPASEPKADAPKGEVAELFPGKSAGSSSGKKEILLGQDVDRVVDECEALIAQDVGIYQRDGQLVRVTHTAESEADAKTLMGTPQIRALQPATLTEHLTRLASFVRFDGRAKRWVPAMPSGAIVAALGARGQWRNVRPLAGITEAPSMRPDGTIVQTPGLYDPVTRFLFMPNEVFPLIADHPTQDEAREALRQLREPFADFPFATEADASAVLAGVLTLLARPAIEGSVPAFLNDATTPGTGKTLVTDVTSMIGTGRPTSKMGYPANDEELSKVLGAYAIRGASLINFDNISRAFGGAPIDRCLTACGAVEQRVLGKSELPSLSWTAVMTGSGNNLEVQGDTGRRVLVSRLETKLENPEERTGFRHHPLLPWVAAQRPRLVHAALTILRAYVVAGRPSQGLREWGSFEKWSTLIASALVFAGASDPMGARASGDGVVNTEKVSYVVLLRGLKRLDEGGGMTAKEVIARLYPPQDRAQGPQPPDGNDDMREAVETLTEARTGRTPEVSALSYVLRRLRGRILGGGIKLVRADEGSRLARWRVEDVRDEQHYRDDSDNSQ